MKYSFNLWYHKIEWSSQTQLSECIASYKQGPDLHHAITLHVYDEMTKKLLFELDPRQTKAFLLGPTKL